MRTVCKFRCQSVKHYDSDPNGSREYEFWAQYDPNIPEDQRFATATPNGHVTITVNNPNVEFEPGKFYFFSIEE